MQFYAKHVTECFPLHAIAIPALPQNAVFAFFNKKNKPTAPRRTTHSYSCST